MLTFIPYLTDARSPALPKTPDLDAQKTRITECFEVLAHQRKVDLADWHTDFDAGGNIRNRPVLAGIMDSIEKKEACGIAVYSACTLGLSSAGVLELVRQVATRGGHVVFAREGHCSLNPEGLSLIRFLYTLGQCRPGKVRGRQRTLSQRPKRSRYLPFGWRLGRTSGPWERKGNSDLEPVRNPTEQVLLQQILAECDGSGQTAYALACKLNAEGRHHPRLKKPWKAGNVLAIHTTATKYQQDAHVALIELSAAQ